ncbi:Uncharacterized protein MLTONO_4468 [Mesorhizobium loti]|nr:Uncharacterized protein MLTONO_4468 [Mesorhizobium loti]
MARTLVECLKLFNRKERYWLIRNALGERGKDLPLSNSFRKELGDVIKVAIPKNAWWAIDYHIDWLFGALVLDRARSVDNEPTILENPIVSASDEPIRRFIRGTQEDFDFVVAFSRTIILVEAKGVTSWGNDQIVSKHQRLCEWRDFSHRVHVDGIQSTDPIRIFVVLMSPGQPKKLKPLDWPSFVNGDGKAPFYLTLDLSDAPEVFRVPVRCDDNRESAHDGDRWRINDFKRPRPN